MIKNILITGGAGNLGRVVSEELKDRYNITLFDRTRPQDAPIPWETNLPFVLGDLTDFGDCMRGIAQAKADAVLHFGALAGPTELMPPRYQQRMREDETMRVNTMGTFYMIDAARRLGVQRFAMASTYYVLSVDFNISGKPFWPKYLPIDEKHPCEPESTYGLSKLLDEQILATFQRAYDIGTVAFRLMGVEYAHRPVHKYGIRPEARPGHVGGPMGTTWQYVEARDIAQACDLYLQSPGFPQFEAFYLSTDTALAEETADAVRRLYPDIAHLADGLKGYEGIISIKKAQEMLGYQPKYSWRNQENANK
jgi:nucleoside-diphosphate-sugar epimerase